MPRKRRQTYSGCWIEAHRGRLRLRFRVRQPDGTPKKVTIATGHTDTPEQRRALMPLVRMIGAAVDAGKTLEQIRQAVGEPAKVQATALERSALPVTAAAPRPGISPTVAEYYERWIREQLPVVRRAQARDYRRHLTRYILPLIGHVRLADLRPSHVRGLQADLLEQNVRLKGGGTKKRSVKHVKNILAGSFRAMIHQARIDDWIARDIFAGLKWPRWTPPPPDPFALDEQQRIIAWFHSARFGFHPGQHSTERRFLPHPAFHAYVHLLFTTGMRPSEASGLQWGDVDLANRRLQVARSRHLYSDGDPKTAAARRTVELFEGTVDVLRALQPLHVRPEMKVFTNTNGAAIEPNSLLHHWYRCLRALGIRVRGLYATKDTFVTTAFRIGVRPAWLEAQTGVSYSTLRRHYGAWAPGEEHPELDRFSAFAPSVFGPEAGKLPPTSEHRGGQFPKKPRKAYVERMREGGLEPPRESH